MKIPLILFAALAGVGARAALIDDFSVSYFNSVQTGTWVDFQSGTMLSGERDVMFDVLSNPLGQFSDFDVDGLGHAIFSNGFGTSSNISLQYDGINDEAANTGPGKTLTNGGTGNALLSGFNDTLRVAFLDNDHDVMVTAVARLNGNVIGSNSATRFANSGIGNLDIAMNPNVLASADSLTFVFNGTSSSDYAISKIESVPEPASMTLAALLLGAIARRKLGFRK
ncbi:MAG: hypothetical protein JSS66_14805 [Armatimonadetes bacterium]|nr:hypothetical protein [Armatimonadota bacterium]